jgi:hypothetical protein
MSDDEESITGSLRRLQISIPHLGNQQQEKGSAIMHMSSFSDLDILPNSPK